MPRSVEMIPQTRGWLCPKKNANDERKQPAYKFSWGTATGWLLALAPDDGPHASRKQSPGTASRAESGPAAKRGNDTPNVRMAVPTEGSLPIRRPLFSAVENAPQAHTAAGWLLALAPDDGPRASRKPSPALKNVNTAWCAIVNHGILSRMQVAGVRIRSEKSSGWRGIYEQNIGHT